MKKIFLFYSIVELFFLIGIFVLISIRISSGAYIQGGYRDNIEIIYTTLKLSSTLLSLGLMLYILNIKKEVPLFKRILFLSYFILIFIADLFFSLFQITLGGLISFLLAYILIAIYLYKHYSEILIRIGIFLICFIIAIILNKLSFNNVVLIALGSTLFINMAYGWVRYIKSKKRLDFYLALAITLALISDSFIALRATILTPKVFNDLTSYIIWPTYILCNFLLILHYEIEE